MGRQEDRLGVGVGPRDLADHVVTQPALVGVAEVVHGDRDVAAHGAADRSGRQLRLEPGAVGSGDVDHRRVGRGVLAVVGAERAGHGIPGEGVLAVRGDDALGAVQAGQGAWEVEPEVVELDVEDDDLVGDVLGGVVGQRALTDVHELAVQVAVGPRHPVEGRSGHRASVHADPGALHVPGVDGHRLLPDVGQTHALEPRFDVVGGRVVGRRAGQPEPDRGIAQAVEVALDTLWIVLDGDQLVHRRVEGGGAARRWRRHRRRRRQRDEQRRGASQQQEREGEHSAFHEDPFRRPLGPHSSRRAALTSRRGHETTRDPGLCRRQLTDSSRR